MPGPTFDQFVAKDLDTLIEKPFTLMKQTYLLCNSFVIKFKDT